MFHWSRNIRFTFSATASLAIAALDTKARDAITMGKIKRKQ